MHLLFKISIGIIVLSLFTGCDSRSIHSGNYSTYKLSPFKRASLKLSGYDGYSGGVHLNLQEDSTYHYSTCGHILKGKWSDRSNHIFLKVDSAFQRVDSIRSYAIPLDSVWFYNEGVVFNKKENTLWNTHFNYITILKKQE